MFDTYKREINVAIAGLILIGGGYYWYQFNQLQVTELQVTSISKEAIVDIQGAVNKPGVYTMPPNARVQDLLDASGGVAEGADTKWIESSLNRAKKLMDSEKIYIPSVNDQTTNPKSQNLININAASQAELETLAGIGPTLAAKIINARPYQSAEELVSRKILSAKQFVAIKDQIQTW
ncbi:MAG: ComEA family DNA-binding protein [Patescibacteria group bacterium]